MNGRIQNKNLAFFSFVVCIFSFILLLLSLLEYEMLHSLFLCSQIEKEYQGKLEKGELIENILFFEKQKMGNFLEEFPEKTMDEYFNCGEHGEFLKKQGKDFYSQGGYFLEKDLPEMSTGDFYKVYYVKYYEIPEYRKKYKIKVLIEYHYGKNRKIQNFISKKIIEMRIYLE